MNLSFAHSPSPFGSVLLASLGHSAVQLLQMNQKKLRGYCSSPSYDASLRAVGDSSLASCRSPRAEPIIPRCPLRLVWPLRPRAAGSSTSVHAPARELSVLPRSPLSLRASRYRARPAGPYLLASSTCLSNRLIPHVTCDVTPNGYVHRIPEIRGTSNHDHGDVA